MSGGVCTCPCSCGARVAASPIRIRLSVLIEAVAKECEISEDALLGDSRQSRVARPRQLLYLLARRHSGLSLSRIGYFLDQRDHSTVISGAAKMAALLESDRTWAVTAERALYRAYRLSNVASAA